MRTRSRPWVYIIGPYTGANATEQFDNCMMALNVARDVWDCGGAALCPHFNSYAFDACATHREFVAAYKRLMLKCDGVVVLKGWRSSVGSKVEVASALKAKMPIWYNDFMEDVTMEQWIAGLRLR